MKICILADRIPPESRGGAEQVAWRSAQALRQKGHEVSIITTTARPLGGIEGKTIEGIAVFYIHSAYHERWRAWRSLYNPGVVKEVKKILEQVKPEVVHAHNIHYHLSYHSLRIAKHAGARVILTAHDVMLFTYGKLIEFIDPQNPVCKKEWDYRVTTWQKIKRFKWRYNPLRQVVIKRYLQNVHVLLAVSNELRKALVQNGLPNATVLHTGIAIEEWEVSVAAVETFKNKHQLNHRKIILFGGRINAPKGGVQLLKALREVIKQEPTALLLIAGTRDPYLESLEELAAKSDMKDVVTCTGWLEGNELHAAYHAADLVVVPSICFDSFPTINLEAMASGKPVVATCFGGSSEQIIDGETGYVINPYDTTTFAARLAELLKDDVKRLEFGEQGYICAKEKFSLEQYLKLLISNYAR